VSYASLGSVVAACEAGVAAQFGGGVQRCARY